MRQLFQSLEDTFVSFAHLFETIEEISEHPIMSSMQDDFRGARGSVRRFREIRRDRMRRSVRLRNRGIVHDESSDVDEDVVI